MKLNAFTRNSRLKDKQIMKSTITRALDDSEIGFIVSGQRVRTLECCITTTLRERTVDQKGYSNGSAARKLA
jgi:hypothetical protein